MMGGCAEMLSMVVQGEIGGVGVVAGLHGSAQHRSHDSDLGNDAGLLQGHFSIILFFPSNASPSSSLHSITAIFLCIFLPIYF